PSGWPLLFGGPLLVALVVLGGLTWARQPDAEPVTDFLFNGELLEDKELLIGRKWTLSADGDTVFGFLTITNYSERETFGGTYEEVLPREMAPDPRAVTSRPPVEGNPGDAAGHSVLRYQIADKLSPRSKLNIAYSLAVGPEAAEDGLERWAEQRVEAVEDYNAWAEANAQDAQEIPVRLASFDILTPSPVRLNLETPALRLDVRGTLDNGQPAPPLVLALIEWTSDDAAVVEVAGGALAPGRPGTTTVRARSGTLERTVEVIVTERGRVTASPAPQPAPLISQDRDFPVVPAPGATARPAPTQPPPTALPPTSRVTTTTTPSTTTPPRPDGDGDGVPDESDNCPSVPNPDQINSDGVGSGDACDADGDGYSDDFDNCPSVANDQVDTDGTGGGDACDPDDDGDGVEDSTDNCRTVANVDQVDTDDDLIGNACDDDRDGDGLPNDGDPFPDDRANQGSTSTSGVTDLSTTTS
ncbi:MAG: thrombospondin type 3 repeat-containing protein, partial [Actinomycetota bacterium]|nr:thrombospondin type 3 repeat-containing protein [Actinomycetota bacterium]